MMHGVSEVIWITEDWAGGLRRPGLEARDV